MFTLFTPREGSKADQVITHLKTKGGHLTYADVERKFGVTRNNITSIFGRSINAGLLEVFKVADGDRTKALRIPSTKEAIQKSPAPATKNATVDDKGSPFTNPPTGVKGLLPAGKILISAWSDGEVYVHGLQVMSDGSVLFTKPQMREIVLNMADPLGIRI